MDKKTSRKRVIDIISISFLVMSFSFVFYLAAKSSGGKFVNDQVSSVMLVRKPKTIAQIQQRYNTAPVTNSKVKILLVPGHEPGYGGAEYKSLKERDMTLELSEQLQGFFENNSRFETFTTRTATAWNPEFDTYFKTNWDAIIDWRKASHEEVSRLISIGSMAQTEESVGHNVAPQNVAVRLYGITKWANEHDIDIEIHIHFNDDRGHGPKTPGKYSGFAIYVPVDQYYNSTSTKAIANTVYKRLTKYNPVSNLPGESEGIIDEPDLIAVGSNNTADSASMIIEYSYIYEPQFENKETRSLTIRDMAYQTYLGLQDFFDPNTSAAITKDFDSSVLPYVWNMEKIDKDSKAQDIFALQTALMVDGVYPPKDRLRNDCPRSGAIKSCTKSALDDFQKKYNITGESGFAGPKTIQILKEKFSAK